METDKIKNETGIDLGLYQEMNEELQAFISLYKKRLSGANTEYRNRRTLENKKQRDIYSGVLSKCLNASGPTNDLSIMGKAIYAARKQQREEVS